MTPPHDEEVGGTKPLVALKRTAEGLNLRQ